MWVHRREGREGQVCGCTEGEGGGKDAQREREEQEHLDVQKGRKLEGCAGLQRKGTEKGEGERCVYVNRRVGVVGMEERGEICRRKERVTTAILLSEPRFSPDGSLIVVGSDDACVDIYTTQGLSRVGYCRGIPSFVTHLDWSQDGKYLQVCIMCIEEGPVSCL